MKLIINNRKNEVYSIYDLHGLHLNKNMKKEKIESSDTHSMQCSENIEVNCLIECKHPKLQDESQSEASLKGWFHEPTNQADKSHEMADKSVTANKIIDRRHQFNWSADQCCLSFH